MVANLKYIIKRISEPSDAFLRAFEGNIRDSDKRELLAYGSSVFDEIKDSIICSDECWAAETENGDPIVVYGRTKVEGQIGTLIWCLGTKRLKDYWRPFARESRKQVQQWAQEYGPLWNAAGVFNDDAIRWLSWCGATFGFDFQRGSEMFRSFCICEEEI